MFSFSVNKKKTLVKNNFFSRYIKQVLLDKNSLFSPETPVILSPGHIFSLANYSDKLFRPWTQFLVLTRLNSWRKDRTLSWSGLFSREKIVKNYTQLIELIYLPFFPSNWFKTTQAMGNWFGREINKYPRTENIGSSTSNPSLVWLSDRSS